MQPCIYICAIDVWLYLWFSFLEVISLILVNMFCYEYNTSVSPTPLERNQRRKKMRLDVGGQCAC
jgi:hypothetical protein